jgi:lipopolysaccharide biosynthesis glycosyltransferase
MKLFIGTNSNTIQSLNGKLLENSVRSAVQNTNFDIYVIFDGKKNELNLPPNVNIIEHRHRCYNTFLNSERTKREGSLNISSGTFLRTEIPFLINKLGFDDEFCLYTDYDVIFQKSEYSELDTIKPKYFAASPESDINNWSYINGGVMLMNIKTLFDDDVKIMNYINDNFDNLSVWDQTLYNDVYSGKIDKLPVEYNWRPYWGINEKSKIIHFHGAKPRSVEPEWRYNLPEIKRLRDRNEEGYEFYNKIFEKINLNKLIDNDNNNLFNT